MDQTNLLVYPLLTENNDSNSPVFPTVRIQSHYWTRNLSFGSHINTTTCTYLCGHLLTAVERRCCTDLCINYQQKSWLFLPPFTRMGRNDRRSATIVTLALPTGHNAWKPKGATLSSLLLSTIKVVNIRWSILRLTHYRCYCCLLTLLNQSEC